MTAHPRPTLPRPAQGLVAKPGRPGIDPRGPRFSAAITAVLLLVVVGLGLGTAAAPPATVGARASEPAFILFAIVTALFAVGAVAGVQRHPYSWLFRHLVRRRLGAPGHLEDPEPPTFSQGVGLVVTLIGVVLHLLGVPFGLVVFAGLAFIAAFLNAVFDYCVGCQIYLLLTRAGILGRRGSVA
jgi:hypothetical protein